MRRYSARSDRSERRYWLPDVYGSHNALLLSEQQQQMIISLLNGQPQGVFLDLGQYYSVMLRPLLPDEIAQRTLAMLGSAELDYTGVPLQAGPVPVATPTR